MGFMAKVYKPPRPRPQKTRLAKEPPRSPATSTSAQAVPSGKVRLPCSLTISWRRSGIMKRTPSHPPISARKKMRQYSVLSEKPRKISAGMEKITPAATDSPAEPVVCTMLFSRRVERPKARRMLIDRTAIGMEAETVRPARNPTYTDNAPNKMPKSEPRITARRLNSATVSSAAMYGLNSAGGAVELHCFVAIDSPESAAVARTRKPHDSYANGAS